MIYLMDPARLRIDLNSIRAIDLTRLGCDEGPVAACCFGMLLPAWEVQDHVLERQDPSVCTDTGMTSDRYMFEDGHGRSC